MKKKYTKCLVMGALAIGMTSTAMADAAKQLCFQINGDINNSTQIDKIYLTVNTVGVATGNGCFYSISDPSATPSCSPLTGNLTGTFPEAFLSLTGNWQRTIGSEVVSEDTKVSVHYDFKKLSGEGIAKTLKTVDRSPPQEINSSEGSVSRIACPKPIVNLLKHLPALKIITQTPTPNALIVTPTQPRIPCDPFDPTCNTGPKCPSTAVKTACNQNPNITQANCDNQYLSGTMDKYNQIITPNTICQWSISKNQCENTNHECQ